MADSLRVRKSLDNKPDELKQSLPLIREGRAKVVDGRDGKQHDAYLFLFYHFLYVTREVKAGSKYKMILAIRLRPAHEVTGDDEETFSATVLEARLAHLLFHQVLTGIGTCFLNCGKATFFITAEDQDTTLGWMRDLRAAIAGEHDPNKPKAVFMEVDGERVWDVKAGLSAEQKRMLEDVHSRLDQQNLDPYLRKWCDDACICRFLRARNWNMEQAFTMMKSTLKWRAEVRPDEIKLEDIEHAASTGDLYLSPGRDRWGRLLVYMRPGKAEDTPEVRAQYVRYMAWVMETGSKILDTNHTGVEKMLWIVDFQGCKISGGIEENIKISKETITVMQDHYPERLFKGFVLNPPLPFFVLWKVVSAFFDPITRSKINFIRKTKDHRMLQEFIAPNQLEAQYGGELPPFDALEWKKQFFEEQTPE